MEFDVRIEIPRGSRNSCEVDHASDLIRHRRSQFGPTTAHLRVETLTVRKWSHCLVGDCSRTDEKSVPSDSPRCLLAACVILGSSRAEERIHDGSEAFCVGAQLKVAAVIDMQLAAWYQPVHDPRVDQRDDGIVVTGQDQGGRPQPRQPGRLVQPTLDEQLVIVAPGPPRACRGVQQVTGQGRVLPRAAPVQLTGDVRRVSRVQVATRREPCAAGPADRPGTMSAPGAVATSTRRRTRSGRLSANCCASPPPQETPRTSACR